MKKIIKLEDLGCANCAAKIEDASSKLDGVISIKLNFMTQKMTLETEDEKFDEIFKEIKKIANKIEPDMVFLNS
jgi:copper chaperone CopZ